MSCRCDFAVKFMGEISSWSSVIHALLSPRSPDSSAPSRTLGEQAGNGKPSLLPWKWGTCYSEPRSGADHTSLSDSAFVNRCRLLGKRAEDWRRIPAKRKVKTPINDYSEKKSKASLTSCILSSYHCQKINWRNIKVIPLNCIAHSYSTFLTSLARAHCKHSVVS